MLRNSTQVPNHLLDKQLPLLKPSEILVLLVIVRQTYGWVLPNGKRKSRDWISQKLFVQKTGLSRRTISRSIDSLIQKEIIKATDYKGQLLSKSYQRKGRSRVYFQYLLKSKKAKTNVSNEQNVLTTKLTLTKNNQGVEKLSDWKRYQQIKDNSEYG